MARHRKRRGHDGGHENHERWLLTYADMITLLMVLFIVLFAISQVDQKKFDALHDGLARSFGNARVLTGSEGILDGSTHQSVDPTRVTVTETPPAQDTAAAASPVQKDPGLETLRQQIAAALAAKGLSGAVRFEREQRGLVVDVITDKVLFDLGSAQLRDEGRAVLDAIDPLLRNSGRYLAIEGHTDDLPIHGGPFPSNWELSAVRATTVLRYLVEKGGIAPDHVSAAGYADTRPIAANDSPAHRARNRRVAIVVLATDYQPGQPAAADRTGSVLSIGGTP